MKTKQKLCLLLSAFILINITACGYSYQEETNSFGNYIIDLEAIDEFYLTIEDKPVYGVLIVKDGNIVSQYYKDDYDENIVFSMNSCAKSFTSALVGIAIEQGIISNADTYISEFFPQLINSGDERREQIMIRHLLDMTSGYYWKDEMFTWEGNFSLAIEADDMIEFLLNREMEHDPGKVFNYDSGGHQLLSAIIQERSSDTLAAFAQKNLFEPMGADSVQWGLHYGDWQGITTGGFDIHMTLEDAAKFGQLYLNKGKCDEKQIIPKEWVTESTKTHSRGTPYFGEYGFSWWINKIYSDCDNDVYYEMYYAMGAGGQMIFIIPELNSVVVFACGFPLLQTKAPLRYLPLIVSAFEQQ